MTPDPIGVHIRNVWDPEGLAGMPDGLGNNIFTSFGLVAVPTGSWKEIVSKLCRPMPSMKHFACS